MANFVIPYVDASDEDSQANYAVSDAITDGDLTLLFDATVALTVAGDQVSKLVTSVDKDGAASGIPANKLAQRENKFLCTAIDVNGNVTTREIPCADLTQTDSSASQVDLSAGVGATFKTEWDKSVLSNAGLATTLQKVEFVGRNI